MAGAEMTPEIHDADLKMGAVALGIAFLRRP
jgi:hypothetical protein